MLKSVGKLQVCRSVSKVEERQDEIEAELKKVKGANRQHMGDFLFDFY